MLDRARVGVVEMAHDPLERVGESGTFPGELGAPGGTDYQATFTGFATSTTSNVAPSQILAW